MATATYPFRKGPSFDIILVRNPSLPVSLAMEPEEQMLFMVGRRTGIFARLDDMNDAVLLKHVENACQAHHVGLDNVENFTAEMMKRFI